MSDPVTAARTAREALARGLNALQSDPNVPAQLLELAAPIAQAMGALHAIERSNGTQLTPHAEVALNHTRNALGQLQSQPPTYEAVSLAMEAVAMSLASVHALNRMALPTAPTAPQPIQNVAAQPIPLQSPVHRAPAPVPAPQVFNPAPQPSPSVAYAPDPFAAGPAPGALIQKGLPGQATSSLHPPSPPAVNNAHVVNADLGTQSATNFYKGLSGNDIIEHGGLFVSTYMIPPLGTAVRLKISLPGGYEFEANALVKWSREASDDNAAPPGFGAQFTHITPEARQLVYRYTRNREPLFHDDL